LGDTICAMSNEAEQHDPAAKGVSQHESNNVGRPRRNLLLKRINRMDLLIATFAALPAISGAALGVVGIFTQWKSKETIAVWSLYFTIVFTVTTVFLIWQKRIWDSPSVVSDVKTFPCHRITLRARFSLTHSPDSVQNSLQLPFSYRSSCMRSSRNSTARIRGGT
jgi:hypothetical protein